MMVGLDSARASRYAGWSAYISAALSVLASVFLFLFYGLEVPRLIAAGGEGSQVFGTLSDIAGMLQFLFMLPLPLALRNLAPSRYAGLSWVAMALGVAGLLTEVIAQALLVARVISFAVNLPFVLAGLALIGMWMALANHLGRSAGALPSWLAWLGEATGIAFILGGGLGLAATLAGSRGLLSAVAAHPEAFARQYPVIVAAVAMVAVAGFLAFFFGSLVWLIGLGRGFLAVAARARDASFTR